MPKLIDFSFSNVKFISGNKRGKGGDEEE